MASDEGDFILMNTARMMVLTPSGAIEDLRDTTKFYHMFFRKQIPIHP